ncbi:hypothetical protein [Nocardioides sp. Leaf285]|uniref:hypothetical protein n=1 Tax=Nocardioides sp. Leaf285 TaxID=1736322 RepID=UPI000703682C|nr:hypothetical protein [Nocardioides sp. Leaf285]KQP63100.1 hypothetical protein ASF47_18995 [Nocardioides sp. Leaf285]
MSTPADAARESSRRRDGRFGAQRRGESAVSLPPQPPAHPAADPDYQSVAQRWLTHPDNPDGWLVDPEALHALEEAAYDAEREGRDPVDVMRAAWRHSRDRYNRSGSPEDAAFMIAIEKRMTAQ